MTETFTWSPRIDANESITYRKLTAQYGDGYKQEVGDGINTQVASWDLTFVRAETDADNICNFLDNHKGYKTFNWTPPWGSATLWTCSNRKRNYAGGNFYTITVTFTQSFKP